MVTVLEELRRHPREEAFPPSSLRRSQRPSLVPCGRGTACDPDLGLVLGDSGAAGLQTPGTGWCPGDVLENISSTKPCAVCLREK